jgi:hypothetical protein
MPSYFCKEEIPRRRITVKSSLKVPKCGIFDLFDFNDFYVLKSLQVGDFRDEIERKKNNNKFEPDTYNFIFAQCTLATI